MHSIIPRNPKPAVLKFFAGYPAWDTSFAVTGALPPSDRSAGGFTSRVPSIFRSKSTSHPGAAPAAAPPPPTPHAPHSLRPAPQPYAPAPAAAAPPAPTRPAAPQHRAPGPQASQTERCPNHSCRDWGCNIKKAGSSSARWRWG